MKKPAISTLVGGYASNTQLNTIFEGILDAFDNTISRDGSTPNTMDADLDLNGNDVINGGDINADRLFVSGVRLVDATAVPNWEGAWGTATTYAKNDLVREDGVVYICLSPHTSGTFSTDLTSNLWEIFAAKGSAGAGTGDLLAANNLSDLTSATTARSNLGLGTVATESTLPIAKGGTGASSASAALTALGVASHSQSVWDTGTSTAESTITPAKLDAKIDAEILAQATPILSFSASTATTSGTAHSITGISSTAREIEIYFTNLNMTGNLEFLIQLIDTGTPLTSGYTSSSADAGADKSSTAGFVMRRIDTRPLSGIMRIVRTATGAWVESHACRTGTYAISGGGHISGVTTVTGIRLTNTGGTFSAGSFVISWR